MQDATKMLEEQITPGERARHACMERVNARAQGQAQKEQ